METQTFHKLPFGVNVCQLNQSFVKNFASDTKSTFETTLLFLSAFSNKCNLLQIRF